jgi:TetR/AcrR family transcriptional repressor of nem operon
MARPREFNREEVLERAIAAFWCRGYEATSVQDLLHEMGINRGSLYDTFGDKHTLFLAAIDRYYDRALAGTIASLEAPGPARDAIERTVREMAECAGGDALRRGCLMTNSAVELAPHCSETAERVARYYRDTEEAFERTVARARAEGDVARALDDRTLARVLTCGLQGLQVYAKVIQEPGALCAITAAILAVLGEGPPRQ